MSKISKFFWYMIAICALVLFLLILVSSCIQIGERLRQIHFGVEIAFYVVVFILFFFGIINPIRIIVTSPSLAIVTSVDAPSKKNYEIYQRVAKNIVKNNPLPNDQIAMLENYKTYEELQFNLEFVFDKSIRTKLNNEIIKNAKTVMISTAICQNARVDMISVFAINLKMIKDLVRRCGFRPSMKNLSKLTVNVFGTALIAEGLENMSIDEILPSNVMSQISDIPLIKPLISSVTQGIANSLLTIRIGIITRKYLFRDGNCITKEEIRRQSLKESIKLIPLVIAGTITFFPKRIVRFFTKKKEDGTSTDVESA